MWGGQVVMGKLFALILTVSVLASLTICPQSSSCDSWSHAPILVDGDNSFLTPGSGVVRGSGSAEDPYVIEGWRIETSSENGIEIRNTTSNLVISDVSIISRGHHGSGIKLYNVSNAVILDCSITGFGIGINAAFCTDISISRSQISHNMGNGLLLLNTSNTNVLENRVVFSNGTGVYLLNCDRTSLRLNLISGSGADGIVLDNSPASSVVQNSIEECGGNGIYLYMSAGALVADNTVRDSTNGISAHLSRDCSLLSNDISEIQFNGIFLHMSELLNVSGNAVDLAHYGIRFRLCTEITVKSNTISQSNYGVFSLGSVDLVVAENTLQGNLWNGLTVHGSAELSFSSNRISGSLIGVLLNCSHQGEIRDNIIEGNFHGLYMEGSTSFDIVNNSFVDNYLQAYDDYGPENRWNGSYEVGGNYWSDYDGVDRYSGPMQDAPGSDGIGDSPYLIDADSIDHYPLMGQRDDSVPRDEDMGRSILLVSLALIGGLAFTLVFHRLFGRLRGRWL